MHASPFRPLALILLALALTLVSCTPVATPAAETQPAAPTLDQQVINQTLEAVQTSAVETVLAELTANAPVATDTPVPTSVPPTQEPTIPPLPSNTPVPVLPTNTFVPLPTLTSTPSAYSCEVTKLNPAWNTTMKPGTDFDFNVTLKNTGTHKWSENSFDFRYSSGTKFGAGSKVLDLPETVANGDKVQFIVDMVAPDEVGTYKATWTLAGDGFTACSVTIQIQTED